jgi:hypothetical protein
MWRIFFVLAIILLPYISIGEVSSRPGELTFTQFTGLFTMKQDVIMDYMELRKWEFDGGSEETKDTWANLTWKYNRNGNYSSGELTVYYKGNFNKVELVYTTPEQVFYVNMKAEAKEAGLVSIKSGFHDGWAYTDYEGKNIVLEFATQKQYVGKTPITVYRVTIYDKNYYWAEVR